MLNALNKLSIPMNLNLVPVKLFLFFWATWTLGQGNLSVDLNQMRVSGSHSNVAILTGPAKRVRSRHLSHIYRHRKMDGSCSGQVLLKIRPINLEKFRLRIGLTYGTEQPQLWTFHLGEQRSAMGYGNGGNETETGMQLQIHNGYLTVYSNPQGTQKLLAMRTLLAKENNVMHEAYKAMARNQHVQVQLIIRKRILTIRSKHLRREMQVVGDFGNKALYVAANRAIGTDALYGQGLCLLEVLLNKRTSDSKPDKIVKRSSCRAWKRSRICPHNAQCGQNRKKLKCTCTPGFRGSGHYCHDINECKIKNGQCAHECRNTVGSYKCLCRPGFQLQDNGRDCQDLDECSDPEACPDGVCLNGVGSYICLHYAPGTDLNCSSLGCDQACNSGGLQCLCFPGYRLAPDGKSCLRQCSVNNGGCDQYCHTTQTAGSLCGCQPGYVLDRDNSTCHVTCSMDNGGCERMCRQTDRGPLCLCPHGFVLSMNRKSCIDIDECETNNGGCQFRCVNSRGSYECLCPPGFTINPDTKTCTDINECTVAGTCEEYCTNSIGSYSCSCKAGFHLYAAKYCADVNECSMENGGCAELCINTPSSYRCSCPEGMTLHPNNKDCIPGNCTAGHAGAATVDCAGDRCTIACHQQHTMHITPNAYSITCNLQHNATKRHVLTIDHPVEGCTGKAHIEQNIKDNENVCDTGLQLLSFSISCRQKGTDDFLMTVELFSTHTLSDLLIRRVELGILKALEGNALRITYGMMSYNSRTTIKCAHPICYQGGCDAGSFLNRTVGLCLPCPSGTYQPSRGSMYCLPCPWPPKDWTSLGAKSSSECADLCPAGHYSLAGVKPCTVCPLGSYQPDAGRSSCVQCGETLTTALRASTASTDCILPDSLVNSAFCPEGHYFAVAEQKCEPCAVGWYQSRQGQRSCIQCPHKLTTDVVASTKITDCKDRVCRSGGGRRYGWLATPNYPHDYPVNVTCQWKLRPDYDLEQGKKKGRKHMIVISRLDIADDMCADYVVIRKSGSPTSATTWQACTSRSVPIAITAKSRKLLVEFHSNSVHTARGFKMHYVTYKEQFAPLMWDIVNDSQLYSVPSYSSVLQNDVQLDTLARVVADLSSYRVYMATDNWKTFPQSFIRKFLWPKIHRFFDLPDFEHLQTDEE